jgi:hypothetical protein
MKGILEAYPVKQANLCTFHLSESLSEDAMEKKSIKNGDGREAATLICGDEAERSSASIFRRFHLGKRFLNVDLCCAVIKFRSSWVTLAYEKGEDT